VVASTNRLSQGSYLPETKSRKLGPGNEVTEARSRKLNKGDGDVSTNNHSIVTLHLKRKLTTV